MSNHSPNAPPGPSLYDVLLASPIALLGGGFIFLALDVLTRTIAA